jgi:hypothetical protein
VVQAGRTPVDILRDFKRYAERELVNGFKDKNRTKSTAGLT